MIDTEDSISDGEFPLAIELLKDLVVNFHKDKLLVFIRPRNIEVLKELLIYKNIDAFDGFVLPKFSLNNADEYLDVLKSSSHLLMPSIEGKELFDTYKLQKLKDKLVPYKEKVILIRFGLEDGITHTLEEVGQEFGVTRERIRQIESKALEKIREQKNSEKLKHY